jgi:hypothetical protein
MLDSIQYEFWFLFTTQADPEPKFCHSGSGSSQKFRLLAALAPAPQHCSEVVEDASEQWTEQLIASVLW